MKLFILAGGFGTRLQSAVPNMPKALAPIGNLPFLHFQMENWIAQGVRSFVFLLHHKADQIIEFLKRGMVAQWRGLDITWIIEATPLGTGGSIANAVAEMQIQGDFLIVNADTWLGFGLGRLMNATAPCIGVIEVNNAARYGCVEFGADHKVTRFLEKSASVGAGWINAGVARLEASCLTPERGSPFSLENDYFPALVRKGAMRAMTLDCDFIDIGVPEDYFRFCRWIETNKSEAL